MALFMNCKSPAVSARRFLLTVMAALMVTTGAARAQGTNHYDSFRFGVCYYPEQWPESYWEGDARRMGE